MAISNIALIAIPVTDQDKSKKFYVDLLGFEALMDYPTGPDTRWVQLRPKGAQTSIALVTKKQKLPGDMEPGEPGSAKGMTLQADNLKELQDTLGHGGTIVIIEQASWGEFFVVPDPDDNTWVVFHPTQAA